MLVKGDIESEVRNVCGFLEKVRDKTIVWREE